MGARKSGKTRHALVAIVWSMLKNPKPCITFAIRFNKGKTLDDTLIKDTEIVLDTFGVNYKFTKSNNEFILEDGSTILVRGLKSQNSNKITFAGTASAEKYDTCYTLFDEAFEFSEEHIARVKEALRGTKRRKYYYCINPWLPTHWIIAKILDNLPYDFEHMKSHGFSIFSTKDKIFHHTTYKINPFLEEDDLIEFKEAEDNMTYQWETVCYGKPGAISGGIYQSHVEAFINFTNSFDGKFRIGIDFGSTDPCAVVLIRIAPDNSKIHVLEEYKIIEKEMKELTQVQVSMVIVRKIEEWTKKYGIWDLKMYGDYSSPYFIKDINDTFRLLGIFNFTCEKCKKQDLDYRIDFHLSILSRGMLKKAPHIFQMREEFELRQQKDITTYGQKRNLVPGNDHLLDAFDYALSEDMEYIYYYADPRLNRKMPLERKPAYHSFFSNEF